MKRQSVVFFLFALFFSCGMLNAQFIDSVKSKSKKVSQSIGGLFKKNNKEKGGSQDNKTSSEASVESTDFDTRNLSFNSKELRSIKIPVYNNVPIVETMHTVKYISLPQLSGMEKDIEIYRYLVELNVLEAAYKSRRSPFEKPTTNTDPSPYLNNNLQTLLKWGLFDENTAQKYFCNPAATGQNKCSDKWGGYQSDEFRQKKVYDDFLSSGIYESLQKTANSLSKEIYFHYAFSLNAYDFAKKGFLISFSPSNGWAGTEYLKEASFLLPLSPEEGEALKEKIKTKDAYGRDQYPLQVLYKLEYSKSTAAINKKFGSGTNSQYAGKSLAAELAEPKVWLYTDAALKNKFREIDISDLVRGVAAPKNEAAASEGIASLLTIQLKNDHLQDFKIIGYKNLPLLGLSVNFEPTLQRFNMPGEKKINYTPYNELMIVYASMDKIKNRKSPFTPRESEFFREASETDRLLTKALSALVTDDAYNEFFCKDKVCAGQKYPGYGGRWGGNNGDEFDRRAAYKKYETSGAEQALLKASQSVTKQAYVVTRSIIGQYDFDKEGFPIDLSTPTTLSKSLGGAAQDPYGKLQILYKLPPDKAKEFKSKYARLSESFPTVNTVVKVDVKLNAS